MIDPSFDFFAGFGDTTASLVLGRFLLGDAVNFSVGLGSTFGFVAR